MLHVSPQSIPVSYMFVHLSPQSILVDVGRHGCHSWQAEIKDGDMVPEFLHPIGGGTDMGWQRAASMHTHHGNMKPPMQEST